MVLPVIPVVVVVAACPAALLEIMEAKCSVVPADGSDTFGPGNCDYSKKKKVHHYHHNFL